MSPINDLHDLRHIIETNVSILDVAGRLGMKVNDNKSALCPFHNDTHPSLRLFEDDRRQWGQHYHCFSCGAHGSMFDLVKKQLSYSYTESLKWISDQFGINYQNVSRYIKLTDIQNSQKAFKDALHNLNNKNDLEKWANTRNIPINTIIDSGSIYVKKHNNFTNYLKTQSHATDIADLFASLGVISKLRAKKGYKETLEQYADIGSAFQNTFDYDHILFPVKDKEGDIVGFAARKSGEVEFDVNIPKYKYSIGFKRAGNLYGIDKVHNAVKKIPKSKKSSRDVDIFIVEGFMDVLRLHSLNLKAVGVLGSSLSANDKLPTSQIKLIGQIAEKLDEAGLHCHLFLDGDAAGKTGTLKAISSLLNIKSEFPNIYIDVTMPSKSKYSNENDISVKDPDEMFKIFDYTKTIDDETSVELLTELRHNTYTIIEFFTAYYFDCNIKNIPWDDINNNKLIFSRLQRYMYINFKELLTNLNNITEKIDKAYINGVPVQKRDGAISEIGNYLKEYSKRSDTVTRDIRDKKLDDIKVAKIPEHLLTKAIDSAEYSYVRSEFSYDIHAFDRIRVIQTLFLKEINKMLNDPDIVPIEPYTPALEPRKANDDPRLKALPCPEDLVVQELILMSLLDATFNVNNEFEMLTVVHNNDSNQKVLFGPRRLLPLKTNKDGKSEPVAVSFAYQFETGSSSSSYENNSLFRHYRYCWNDFNSYILYCVQNYGTNQTVYTERYDLSRYYDTIKQSLMVSVLYEMGKDHEIDTLSTNTDRLYQLMLKYSFNYGYYSPSDGDRLQWPTKDIGIPQGPNLSAYMANIFLFKVDKRVQEVVDRINRDNYHKQLAVYARYVDDIILVAPTRSDLSELESTLTNELSQIDLSLSDKGESISTMSKAEFMKWLYDNKGLPGTSLSPNPSPQNSRIIQSSFTKLKTGKADRRDLLNIIHNSEVIENYDNESIDKLFTESARNIDTLKERDIVHIVKLLWYRYIMKNTVNSENPVLELAYKVRDNYQKYILPADDNETKNDLSGFINPLNKNWYLLVTIMGLNKLLSTQYKTNPVITEGTQSDIKDKFIEFAQHLVKRESVFLAEEYQEFDSKTECMNFLIQIYLAKSFQLIEHLANMRDIRGVKDGKMKPILARFNIGLIQNPNSYISGNIASSDFIKLYNELYRAKYAKEPSRENLKHELFENVIEIAKTFTRSSNDVNIDPNKAPNIYRIISQLRIPIENIHYFISKRKSIQKYLLWRNNEEQNILLLPTHPQIEEDSFTGLCVNTQSRTAHEAVLLHPEKCQPQLMVLKIKDKTSVIDGYKLSCASLNGTDWRQLKDVVNNIPAKDFLQHILGLFNYIKVLGNKQELNNMLINPDNILYNKDINKYLIISMVYDDNPNIRNYAFSGRRSHSICPYYSYVWKLGWALNDLRGLTRGSEVDYINPNTLGAYNGNEWIDNEILTKLLYDLRGAYWKSEETGDDVFPVHIRQYHDYLIGYHDKTEKSKLRFLLRLLQDRKLFRVISKHGLKNENDIHFESGLFLCAEIASGLLHYQINVIQDMKKHLETNQYVHKQQNKLRRSVNALIILADSFELLNNGETSLSNDYASLLRIRAITLYLKKVFVFLLTACINNEKKGRILDSVLEKEIKTEPLRKVVQVSQIIEEVMSGYSDALDRLSVFNYIELIEQLYLTYKYLFEADENSVLVMISNLREELRIKNPDTRITFADLPPISIPSVTVKRDEFHSYIDKIIILEDILKIKVETIYDYSLNYNPTEKGVYVRSRKGELLLSHFSCSPEPLFRGDTSNLERVIDKDLVLNTFTELSFKGNTYEINTITEHLADLSELRTCKTEAPKEETTQQEITKNTKAPVEDSKDTEAKSAPVDNAGVDGKQNKPDESEIGKLLGYFKNIQEDAWKYRTQSKNKLLRVAFFQFEVNSTYRHPASEICNKDNVSSKYREKPHDIPKSNIESENDNQKPKMLESYSCAEYIRREKIITAIEACQKFKVDLLILPEYSVRPETIIYIKKYLEKNDISISILCGTFRVPYHSQGYLPVSQFNTEKGEEYKGHHAVLSLLYHVTTDQEKNEKDSDKYRIITRAKKYQAPSNELIRPNTNTLEPLISKDNKTNIESFKHTYELICSEAFLLTSTVQINSIANRLRYYCHLYYEKHRILQGNLWNVYQEDIEELNSYLSCEQDKFHTNQRRLLLIPAMSSRKIDFYNIGEQLILTAGISTIFCNAVFNNTGIGGSCLITGEAYNDIRKKDNIWTSKNDSPYSDVAPGIFQRGVFNDGALCKDEEALVIVDIDPVYAASERPHRQTRSPRSSLIAHLPLVEYIPGLESNVSLETDDKCACMSKIAKLSKNITISNQNNKLTVNEWVERYLSEYGNFITEYSNRLQKDKKLRLKQDFFDAYLNMFSFSDIKWTEKKLKAFKEQCDNKLCSSYEDTEGKRHPAIFTDILIVSYEKELMGCFNKKLPDACDQYKIRVPSFSPFDKDDNQKEEEKKNNRE